MFLISSSLFSQINIDVIDRSDNSVDLGFDTEKEGVLLISISEQSYIDGLTKGILFNQNIELNDISKVDENTWELFKAEKDKLYNFSLAGLKDKTEYFIYFLTNQSFTQILNFKTLELKPSEDASGIIFRKTDPNAIELTWRNGLGAKRMVLMRKGKEPELPINGIEYSSGPFGSEKARIGLTDTYVIFNGDRPKKHFIKLDSLDYDLYHFNIVEYNGSGETINYLPGRNSTNPRSKSPQIPPPIAYEEMTFEENVIYIKWSNVNEILYYELQVSKDPNFNTLLEEYTDSDVGANQEFAIFLDDKSQTYYWRIRAVAKYGRSDYSNIIEINF